eukprot:UC4_evm4s1590
MCGDTCLACTAGNDMGCAQFGVSADFHPDFTSKDIEKNFTEKLNKLKKIKDSQEGSQEFKVEMKSLIAKLNAKKKRIVPVDPEEVFLTIKSKSEKKGKWETANIKNLEKYFKNRFKFWETKDTEAIPLNEFTEIRTEFFGVGGDGVGEFKKKEIKVTPHIHLRTKDLENLSETGTPPNNVQYCYGVDDKTDPVTNQPGSEKPKFEKMRKSFREKKSN